MKVLFLGGTGFVGAHAVRRLAELGHEVTVVHRGRTEPGLPAEVRHVHHPKLTFKRDDQYLIEIAQDLQQVGTEVVVDMLPECEVDTAIVMRTFRGIARRIVGISSIDVYRAYGIMHRRETGSLQPVPLSETADLRNQYYIDVPWAEKILAERVLLGDSALPGTILRWPMVYGPMDPVRRIFSYLSQMDSGQSTISIEETHAQRRASRGFSENVAMSIVRAVIDDRATGRTYNVGEVDALTELEWVTEIGLAAGWNGQIVTVPKADVPPQLRSELNMEQHWVVDTARIRSELGYIEPIPRPEALKRTIDWSRANLSADLG